MRIASRISGCLPRTVDEQAVLEGAHAVDRERIEIAVDAGVDHDDLLLHLQRRELRLLQELGQPRAAVEQALRRGVEVGAELREGRHLAVLRELALDRPATFFIALVCAAEPTRDTDRPTFTAGRMPW